MRGLLLIVFMIFSTFNGYGEFKYIDVPNELTVEMVLANDEGLINGVYDVRARIFNTDTLERIWYEDFKMKEIQNGAFVLVLNSGTLLDSYEMHQKNIQFVVTVGEESVEIPLLTDFYSYRSLHSEYAWQTRFPDIFYIDRDKSYVGIGTAEPSTHLDVNGAIKLAYEETDVTGAIRLAYNSLRVKHPDRWVDLLYGPLTFIPSRWSEYATNIQLITPNYNIGINMDYPTHKLHVEGDLYVDGELRAGSLIADSFIINSVELSSTDFTAEQLVLFDGDTLLLWNINNLNVLDLPLYGDGEFLTNVGQLAKDFQLKLLSSDHLDGEVIASQNIFPFSIYTYHFSLETLMPDQFARNIFNASTISENAIVSDNIVEESLYFSIFENTNLYDYVPDQFFESNVIATDNVFSYNIQDYSVASINLSVNSIASFNIEDSIVLGAHIADDQVLPSKIKDGEITSDLFSGVLEYSNGGTGVSDVDSNQVLRVADTFYDSNTVMYIDDNQNLGLYDTNSLLTIERDFNHIFEVGSLTSNATIKITEIGSSNLDLKFENQNNQVSLQLNNSGELSFNTLNSSFYLFPTTAVSTRASSSQIQFDVGSAIVIGDSVNSAPEGGTIEYSGSVFRFFNGENWTLTYDLGFGIGAPMISGDSNFDNENSFVGSIFNSNVNSDASLIQTVHNTDVNATNSFINDASYSTLKLNNSFSGLVQNSKISGELSHYDFVYQSNLDGFSSQFDVVNKSDVFSANGSVFNIDQSNVKLSFSVIDSALNVIGDISKSSLVLVDTVFAYGDSVFGFNSQDVRLSGDSNYFNKISMADISGRNNYLNDSKLLNITGSGNNLLAVEDIAINGNDNHIFNAKKVSVVGSGQRIFSDDVHVSGNHNMVVGNKVKVMGNNNVVFNASIDPITVHSNNKLVMNAPNGVHIFTGDNMIVSATERSGGWTMVSDKNLKKSFLPVDHRDTFTKLMNLEVSRWEYVFNKGVYHIGPMAQQFKSEFNIGEDERFITASDADGIAFSALKFLVQETDDLQRLSNVAGNVDLENVELLIKKLNTQLDSYVSSLQMKDAAFQTLLDNNLKQYQLIDRQLKVVSRYLKRIDKKGFIIGVLQLFGSVVLGISVGFYGVKLYHKIRR